MYIKGGNFIMEIRIKELDELMFKTNCLVSSYTGHEEVYKNIGTLMDTITFEGVEAMKEGKNLQVIYATPIVNYAEGYVTFYVTYEYDGKEKDLDIRTTMLSDYQIAYFCDILKKWVQFKVKAA
jgi:hypothetical protein